MKVLLLFMLGGFAIWYFRQALKAPAPYAWVALTGIVFFFGANLWNSSWLLVPGFACVILSRVLHQRSRNEDLEFLRKLAAQQTREPSPVSPPVALESGARSPRKQEKAPRKPETPARSHASSGWLPFTAQVKGAELAAEGGRLHIAEGEFRAQLSITQAEARGEDGETRAELAVSLRFADAEGKQWLVTSLMAPDAFSDAFEDEARRSAIEQQGGFTLLKDAAESAALSLRERALLRDVTTLLDSRREFELRIGERTAKLFLSEEEPLLDVALTEPAGVIVRVKGLTRRARGREMQTLAPKGLVTEPTSAWKEVPSFVWLDQRDLFFCFARPEYHYANKSDLHARVRADEGETILARPTGERSEPQAGVCLQQG